MTLDDTGLIVPGSSSVQLKPYIPRIPKKVEYLTDQELSAGVGGDLFVDTESYPNYHLIAFKCRRTKKILKFEINNITGECINTKKLCWVMQSYRTIGFNTIKYDLPLIWLANAYNDCALIKQASDDIIFRNVWVSDLQKQYNFMMFKTSHIDLIEVCPLRGSLKLYGGRLHAPRLQELPYAIAQPLTEEQIEVVADYNINDLDTTELLCDNLTEPLKLRAELSREYNQDLMSKSDAQIAEAVIGTELKRITGQYPKKPKIEETSYNYKKPDFIFFQTNNLNRILDLICKATYEVGFSGYLELPKEIHGLKIQVGRSTYRIGNGGLHSSETNVAIKSDEEYEISDHDVAGYYPDIILNCQLFPKQLGPEFLTVYRTIRNRRIAAKRAKNISVSECLKITINGTFGKLGSPHSFLYAPDLMLQVTVTGQLALLMLIEQLELNGFEVVSANTDGLVIKCKRTRKAEKDAIIKMWERVTGFITEETSYKAIYSRDVNAYLAVKDNKEIKGKNVYYDPWRGKTGRDQYWKFQKNPTVQICVEAVEKLITDSIPLEQTIKASTDITKFVAVKNVTGGAHKDGYYLGKVIRWYYATGIAGTINYIKSNNKVPDTDGAYPCMDLPPTFPTNIDYSWYVRKANQMLEDLAFSNRQFKFF